MVRRLKPLNSASCSCDQYLCYLSLLITIRIQPVEPNTMGDRRLAVTPSTLFVMMFSFFWLSDAALGRMRTLNSRTSAMPSDACVIYVTKGVFFSCPGYVALIEELFDHQAYIHTRQDSPNKFFLGIRLYENIP